MPLFLVKLDILLQHRVRAGLAVIEMGEWTIIVRVSAIVSPFPLVALLVLELDIFLGHGVGRSFSVVEVSGGSVVVGVA